jgi:hypothetical protein
MRSLAVGYTGDYPSKTCRDKIGVDHLSLKRHHPQLKTDHLDSNKKVMNQFGPLLFGVGGVSKNQRLDSNLNKKERGLKLFGGQVQRERHTFDRRFTEVLASLMVGLNPDLFLSFVQTPVLPPCRCGSGSRGLPLISDACHHYAESSRPRERKRGCCEVVGRGFTELL